MRSKVTSSHIFADFLSHSKKCYIFRTKIASRLGKLRILGGPIGQLEPYCAQNSLLCAFLVYKKYYTPLHNLHYGPILTIPWGRRSLQATSLPIFSAILKMLHISNEKWLPPRKNGGYSEVTLARRSLIELQNRLCGPILCSKNNTSLCRTCILDPFGPPHEVEGHFMPSLCRFSFP